MGDFEDARISTLKLDVTSDDDISEVVKTVLEREGSIDIIVNNAGRPHAGNSLTLTSSAQFSLSRSNRSSGGDVSH